MFSISSIKLIQFNLDTVGRMESFLINFDHLNWEKHIEMGKYWAPIDLLNQWSSEIKFYEQLDWNLRKKFYGLLLSLYFCLNIQFVKVWCFYKVSNMYLLLNEKSQKIQLH